MRNSRYYLPIQIALKVPIAGNAGMHVCNPQILIDKIMGSDYETNYDIYEKKSFDKLILPMSCYELRSATRSLLRN